MLENSEERVRLLKAGISDKTIEKLYVIYNNLKIIGSPVLFEPTMIDGQKNESNAAGHEASSEYGCI